VRAVHNPLAGRGASSPIPEPNRTGNFDLKNDLSVGIFKITLAFLSL